MSAEEQAAALKAEGNACLKQQDFDGAIAKYAWQLGRRQLGHRGGGPSELWL